MPNNTRQTPAPNQPLDPNNPYEFITNPGKPPKNKLFFGDKQKPLVIGLFIGIILFVVIGGLIIFSKLTADNNQDLMQVGGTQVQLIKLAEIGATKGRSSQTKALANTLLLSVGTDASELKAYLAARKISIPKKGFTADTKSIEDKLASAEQNNSFDQTFQELLDALGTAYQGQLKTAYNDAEKVKEKKMLDDFNTTIVVIKGDKKE